MKKQIILLITLLIFATPVFAVAIIQKNNDGSVSFICKPTSSIKVKVKRKAKGLYNVIAKGGGSGFSGLVEAKSETHAAQYGCGEKAVPPRTKAQ